MDIFRISGISPPATVLEVIESAAKAAASAAMSTGASSAVGQLGKRVVSGSIECLIKNLFDDLRSALRTPTQTEYCPAQSAPGCPSGYAKTACPGASTVREVLCDPSLSLEQKVQLTLSRAMDGLDADIEKTLQQIAGGGNQVSLEKLHVQLQRLMERRKLMFELMSNLSAKFTEMAKTAIQNLARA